MEQILLWGICLFSLIGCIAGICSFLSVRRMRNERADGNALAGMQSLLLDELSVTREELERSQYKALQALGRSLSDGQAQMSRELGMRQQSMQSAVGEMMRSIDGRFHQFALQNEQQLSGIRASVADSLAAVRADNASQMEQMRAVVDEKLQKTLEGRLEQSFSVVSRHLEEVYKGLGDMQSLAAGVGDLKRVLSNVKSRGVFGEVQLGAILEDVLAPGQYAANVSTKRGSRAFVEYAVLLPGDGDTPVYLPVDAKFPLDAYMQLTQAQEAGEAEGETAARVQLTQRMRVFAKEIRDKYVDPPYTTDFAILFLPFEGLYAEAIRLGLLEALQREFQITLAGPATMAALLNSLQMGFRTLAIQKRSGEVWTLLGAVRTEFDRFAGTLDAAQQRLSQAGDELDKLVGVRTRMIRRRLAQVGSLEQGEARAMIEEDADEEESC